MSAKRTGIVIHAAQQFDIVHERHDFLARIEVFGVKSEHGLVAKRVGINSCPIVAGPPAKQFCITSHAPTVQRVNLDVQGVGPVGVESFEKRELAVILLQLNLVYDFSREIIRYLLVLIAKEVLPVNENLLH